MTGEEMTVIRIRIDRPKIRRERVWLEVLPADRRDPDVARAKAFARARQADASPSDGPTGRRHARRT
jgi:hypothetical protein